jgi:hypothetical protein
VKNHKRRGELNKNALLIMYLNQNRKIEQIDINNEKNNLDRRWYTFWARI